MDIAILRDSIRRGVEAAWSRSGGPGGQNVNKVNTRVTLRLSLSALRGISPAEMLRLREVLAPRITGSDEILVNADGERSRRSNHEQAQARLEGLIISSARLPKTRRPTKPTRASREARLRTKRHEGEVKKNRRFVPDD